MKNSTYEDGYNATETQLIAKLEIGSPCLSLALPDCFSLILYLKWRIRPEKTNTMPLTQLIAKSEIGSPCLSLALSDCFS